MFALTRSHAVFHGNSRGFAPDAKAVLDWIVRKYKARHAPSIPRADGRTLKEITAEFRGELHHTVLCHLAAGQGNMIAYAGGPSKRTSAERVV